MADSACDAVLSTVELLEHILLGLPIKDLLFAQAVCKSWKDMIETSPNLQKALFFRPAGAIIACEEPVDLEKEKKPYPIPFRRWDADLATPKPVPMLNPLLYKIFGRAGMAACISTGEDITAWPKERRIPCYIQDIPAAASKPEASWRRMLLSQPPWPVWWTSPAGTHPLDNEYCRRAFRCTVYALGKFEECEMAEEIMKL